MSFDWKSLLSKAAPLLGTAIGGPLGPLVGLAGGAIARALGGDPSKSSPDDIQKLVESSALTGDQIVALKKAEEEFQIQLAQMGIDSKEALEKLAMEDRSSARSREVQVKDWTPRILAYGVVFAWAMINGFLLKHAMNNSSLPPDMATIIMRVLGTLDAALTFVLGYYFGSSASSARKDELLQQSVPVGTKQ